MAESKPEKQSRLNRVGLSYACKKCGLPKKGHVCLVTDEAARAFAESKTKEKKPPEKKEKKEKAPKVDGEGSLDEDSIFKDIKSMLPDGFEGAGKKKKESGSKKRKADGKGISPPPPLFVPPSLIGNGSGKLSAEAAALLGELDFDQAALPFRRSSPRRPPSLITPEDMSTAIHAAGPSSLMSAIQVPPASLMSASGVFSPGQLMSLLKGSPAPALTPGLSPGTIEALGAMLPSPAPSLLSARKSPRLHVPS